MTLQLSPVRLIVVIRISKQCRCRLDSFFSLFSFTLFAVAAHFRFICIEDVVKWFRVCIEIQISFPIHMFQVENRYAKTSREKKEFGDSDKSLLSAARSTGHFFPFLGNHFTADCIRWLRWADERTWASFSVIWVSDFKPHFQQIILNRFLYGIETEILIDDRVIHSRMDRHQPMGADWIRTNSIYHIQCQWMLFRLLFVTRLFVGRHLYSPLN